MDIEKIARAIAMANGHTDPEVYVDAVKKAYEENAQAESDEAKAEKPKVKE